jgi:hypothetical protein
VVGCEEYHIVREDLVLVCGGTPYISTLQRSFEPVDRH